MFSMLDLLDDITAWQRAGRTVALATLVEVSGSAPRDAGAALALSDGGEIAGSVSGGCVEAALVQEAGVVLARGTARVVEYGISDAEGRAVGLTCGGRLRLLIERVDPVIVAALGEKPDVPLLGLAVRVNGASAGSRLCVFARSSAGSLGDAELDRAVAEDIRSPHAAARPVLRTYGEAGEPHGTVEVFVQRLLAPASMYVFGALDFTDAVAHIGKFLGYHVTVCDARAAFATRERFPSADALAVRWPDDFLRDAPVDERTALVVLTHDEKFDIPLLLVALRSRAGYIGVMGSRKTHARRIAQLREAGATAQELLRLSAPIGLDIGARTPQETAVSIGAELIALANGRSGGRLTNGSGTLRGPR